MEDSAFAAQVLTDRSASHPASEGSKRTHPPRRRRRHERAVAGPLPRVPRPGARPDPDRRTERRSRPRRVAPRAAATPRREWSPPRSRRRLCWSAAPRAGCRIAAATQTMRSHPRDLRGSTPRARPFDRRLGPCRRERHIASDRPSSFRPATAVACGCRAALQQHHESRDTAAKPEAPLSHTCPVDHEPYVGMRGSNCSTHRGRRGNAMRAGPASHRAYRRSTC